MARLGQQRALCCCRWDAQDLCRELAVVEGSGGSMAMIFHRSPACMFCGPFFFAGLTVVGLHCGEEAECKRVACHQFVGAGLRSHCQRRCRASPRNLRKNFSWYQKQGVNIGRFVTSICWDDTDSGRIVCKNLGMRFRRDMRHQHAATVQCASGSAVKFIFLASCAPGQQLCSIVSGPASCGVLFVRPGRTSSLTKRYN